MIPWKKIDPGIRSLIADLNRAGYKTLFCCEGKQSPTHEHDDGGAYLVFDGWVPKPLIRHLLALNLAVTLVYGANGKRTAIYSYWSLDPPQFNRQKWRWTSRILGELIEVKIRKAYGPYKALPIKKCYAANQAFQTKIRRVFLR